MTSPEAQIDEVPEATATTLELFFDLVFVFAFIQVTASLVDDPTPGGIGRAMLVLAGLWWAWAVYAWLTSSTNVEQGRVRLTTLAATGAMLFVALGVPHAFSEHAALFGGAYLLVRVLHLILSGLVVRDDPGQRSAFVRFLPTSLAGPTLILVAAFVDDGWRVAVWIIALAIDYLGPLVVGMGRGWHVEAEHFAERYGLIVMIALGESIIAIGFGARGEIDGGVLLSAGLAVALVSALWWLYFDVAVIFAREKMMRVEGIERARLARDAYGYFHLPMIAGIVLVAFGIEAGLHRGGEVLPLYPAIGLCAGAALYLLGHTGFLFRATGRIFRMRTLSAAILLLLILSAGSISAVLLLGVVGAVLWAVVAYEAIRHREARQHLRRRFGPRGGSDSAEPAHESAS